MNLGLAKNVVVIFGARAGLARPSRGRLRPRAPTSRLSIATLAFTPWPARRRTP